MLDLPHPDAAPRPVSVPAPWAAPAQRVRRFRRVGARALVPTLVMVTAVLGIVTETSTLRLDDLTAWYAVGSLLTGVVIAGLFGVVATGRGALLLAILCVPVSTASTGAAGAVALGCVALAVVVALAMAVADVGDRRLVRAATAGLQVHDVPTTATSLRAFRRLGPVVLVLTALGLAGAAFGGWLWQHDARTVDAFRARAVVVPGIVLAVDEDDYWSRVRLSDGTTIRVPINDGSPRRGEHVEVRYDAASGRAELTDDVFDPTGAAALLGVGLGAAGWALGVGVARRRGRLQALHGAGLAVTLDTRTSTSVRVLAGGTVIAEADDLIPSDLVDPEASVGATGSDTDAPSGDGPKGAAALPPANLGSSGTGPGVLDEFDDGDDLAGLPDDELLRQLRLWGVPEGPVLPGDEDERAPRGPGLVVGLGSEGGGVAIQDVTGRWWLARSTRAPRRVRAVDVGAHRGTVPTATDDLPGTAAEPADVAPETTAATAAAVRDDTTPDASDRDLTGRTAWERFWGRVDQRTGHALVPVLRSTAAWLPWLVAPGAGLLVWWLQSSPDGVDWWGAVVGTWVVASAGHAWAMLGEPVVRSNARGIGVASVVARHRIAWTWVRSIIADDDHLVVRLRLPDGRDDVIVVPRRAPRFLVGHVTEPREAREMLETARLRALTGQVDDRWVAPVTRTAVMTAWWLAWAVAGLVLAAVG